MAAKIDNSSQGTITFSSGNTTNVHGGVVGLSPDLDVRGGWDHGLNWTPPFDGRDAEDMEDDDMTDADMIELADLMIEQWSKFRALCVSGKD